MISIIIKTLNEEARIADAIESALNVNKWIPTEVIVADSASTDRTIEISRKYPVRVVQLSDPNDRSCGVGPQLGFQNATGDFILILDGDMRLRDEFVPAAMELFHQRP